MNVNALAFYLNKDYNRHINLNVLINVSYTKAHKLISIFVSLFLILNSAGPYLNPLKVSAQEEQQSPSPTEQPSPQPTPEVTQALENSPTPTVEVSPTAIPQESVTPTPSDSVSPSPTGDQPSPTTTDQATPPETGPPNQSQDNSSPGSPSSSSNNSSSPPSTLAPSSPTPAPTDQEHGRLSAIKLNNTPLPTPKLDVDASNTETTGLLTTDKKDYSPTEMVLISGSSFKSRESYKLAVSSDAPPPVDFQTNVKADESGSFLFSFQLDGNYKPNYKNAPKKYLSD